MVKTTSPLQVGIGDLAEMAEMMDSSFTVLVQLAKLLLQIFYRGGIFETQVILRWVLRRDIDILHAWIAELSLTLYGYSYSYAVQAIVFIGKLMENAACIYCNSWSTADSSLISKRGA